MNLEDCLTERTEYELHCDECSQSTGWSENHYKVIEEAEELGFTAVDFKVLCPECKET